MPETYVAWMQAVYLSIVMILHHPFHLSLFTVLLLTLSACHSNNRAETSYDGVPMIILDTDIGSSTDDLFALEMLYRYEDDNKCKLLGVVVDREGEACAAVADIMNTYFGHGDTPIGLVRKGIPSPVVWIDYKGLSSYTGKDGRPMFERTISDYSSLPDGWELYRKLLSEAPDKSVTICSIGFVTALAQLLESEADDIRGVISELDEEINQYQGTIDDLTAKRKGLKASILGLYGQNGSGKTALIDVIQLLQFALQGRIIPIIKTSHSSHKQSVRVDAVRNAGHKSDHVFTADDPESISLCRETCRNFIHSVNVFFSQDVNIEHIACTHPGQMSEQFPVDKS